jgi:hypothetical protein
LYVVKPLFYAPDVNSNVKGAAELLSLEILGIPRACLNICLGYRPGHGLALLLKHNA